MSEKVNHKLEQLTEQTKLLLNSQTEAREHSNKCFTEFINLLEDEIAGLDAESQEDKERHQKLSHIASIIKEQHAVFDSEINQDIAFLEGQLGAIDELSQEPDDAKKDEILTMMLDGQELIDTKEFKQNLEADALEAKGSFEAIIDDFKAAIVEGSLDDVLAYLQEIESALEEDEDDVNVTIEGLTETTSNEAGTESTSCCKTEGMKPDADMCCGQTCEPSDDTGAA